VARLLLRPHAPPLSLLFLLLLLAGSSCLLLLQRCGYLRT
jgi:hypothetical protein